MKVSFTEDNGYRYDFDKWEGMSVCLHEDNEWDGILVHDIEDYIIEEEVYNNTYGLENYLSVHYKGEFTTVQYYRWLVIDDNTYDAGETYTERFYTDSDGYVTRL